MTIAVTFRKLGLLGGLLAVPLAACTPVGGATSQPAEDAPAPPVHQRADVSWHPATPTPCG